MDKTNRMDIDRQMDIKQIGYKTDRIHIYRQDGYKQIGWIKTERIEIKTTKFE